MGVVFRSGAVRLRVMAADGRNSSQPDLICAAAVHACACMCVCICVYAGCASCGSKVYRGFTAVWRALKQLFSPKLWSVTVVLIIIWVSYNDGWAGQGCRQHRHMHIRGMSGWLQ